MFALNETKHDLPDLNGVGRGPVYPFASMEVGDSFDAPRDMRKHGKSDGRQNTISACSRGWAKKHNPTAQFATRLIDENTVRCWRVK